MIRKAALLLFIFSFAFTCCPEKEPDHYKTIKSVRGIFSSKDPSGTISHSVPLYSEEVFLNIHPDSVITRYVSAPGKLLPGAYACDPAGMIVYENQYSIFNIYTELDINEDYPAGSLINDILRPFERYYDPSYETRILTDVPIEEYEITQQNPHVTFAFIIPLGIDSLQVRIEGEIEGNRPFSVITAKIALE